MRGFEKFKNEILQNFELHNKNQTQHSMLILKMMIVRHDLLKFPVLFLAVWFESVEGESWIH